MLMFGRLLGMVVEGVATWVMLALYGVPMAGLLGLLTGLLAFLPNIGAPISGLLMVMVGFSGGTEMGLYCVIVYVVVQTVDGNIIVPPALLALDNVVLLPHVASATVQTRQAMADRVFDNLQSFMTQGRLLSAAPL